MRAGRGLRAGERGERFRPFQKSFLRRGMGGGRSLRRKTLVMPGPSEFFGQGATRDFGEPRCRIASMIFFKKISVGKARFSVYWLYAFSSACFGRRLAAHKGPTGTQQQNASRKRPVGKGFVSTPSYYSLFIFVGFQERFSPAVSTLAEPPGRFLDPREAV